jgi:hypothetical protein
MKVLPSEENHLVGVPSQPHLGLVRGGQEARPRG